MDPAEMQALRQELDDMLAKGAVMRVPTYLAQEGYYSRYFLVPKRDGGKRPILNLKPFNKFVRKYKSRLIGTRTLLSMVRRGDWFTSMDLKDAFFHCPRVVRHRKHRVFLPSRGILTVHMSPFRLSPLPDHLRRSVCCCAKAFGLRGIWTIC